jgi:flagellar motor protein MotB
MRLSTTLCLGLLSACVPSAYDQGLVDNLDREVAALQARNLGLQAQLEGCADGGGTNRLYTQFVQVYSGTEVIVERDGPRTVLRIPGALLFSPGSTRVRLEARMVLDMLATGLASHPDSHVRVIGHTDDRPVTGSMRRRYPSNWHLSTARAIAFMDVLSEDFGVDTVRFSVGGRGPVAPAADNDSPEGRQANRRIVVVVGPKAQWDE